MNLDWRLPPVVVDHPDGNPKALAGNLRLQSLLIREVDGEALLGLLQEVVTHLGDSIVVEEIEANSRRDLAISPYPGSID